MVELGLLHIVAQGFEDVADDGIVDIITEKALVDTPLHENDEIIPTVLLLLL